MSFAISVFRETWNPQHCYSITPGMICFWFRDTIWRKPLMDYLHDKETSRTENIPVVNSENRTRLSINLYILSFSGTQSEEKHNLISCKTSTYRTKIRVDYIFLEFGETNSSRYQDFSSLFSKRPKITPKWPRLPIFMGLGLAFGG